VSWFSKHLGIRLDSHTLGNLVKNLSPAAGLVGGPLGIALAGGLSTAGDLARGKSFGQSVRGGLENAALGAGVGSLASHGVLGSTLQGFSGGAPGTAGSAAGSVASDATDGGMYAPSDFSPAAAINKATGAVASGGAGSGGGSGILTKALNAGKSVGKFAGNHDQLSAAALTTLGNVTDPYQHRLEAAEAAGLEGQNATNAYALQRQKAQDAALEPLREAIYGTLGTRFTQPVSPVAANPYGGSYGGGYG